jgi:hypothetical protein
MFFVKNQIDATGLRCSISQFVRDLPRSLFGVLEDGVGPLLSSHQRVAMVLEVVRIEEHVCHWLCWSGRPAHSRKALARAFVAKAVLNIPTTKDLVERLVLDVRLRRVVGIVGRVPSESTFSRAFAYFAGQGLLDFVHEQAVLNHLKDEVVHHAGIDAASLPARERGAKKIALPRPAKQKRGRKPGGKRKDPSRQERQLLQSAQEALMELPNQCDHGMKRGPKGYLVHWKGFKIHASVAEGGIPLAFITTSASVHDSLAAIPLFKLAHQRVGAVLYNLMDKAYAGKTLELAASDLGQVCIVPPKPVKQGEPAPEMEPHRRRRYRHRTVVERFFADLKENHGANNIFVRGHQKVHAHIMLGVLAIFGLALTRT